MRKLGRNNAPVQCGTEEMVSGGTPDPLGNGEAPEAESGSAEDCGSPELVSGGVADPLGDRGGAARRRKWGPSPAKQLERSTGEVIAAFHEAKQELAKEMEANLKQLKAVLADTQRIAKEMEAVLREAKNEPDLQEMAQGKEKGQGWKPPAQKQNQKGQEKAQGGEQRQARGGEKKAAWQPPDFRQEKDASDTDPPPWQPPKAGKDQQQPQAH